MRCSLILSTSQWNSSKYDYCPNCKYAQETTTEFTGMISLIMPTQSWVARYNQLENRMPGIYAIKIHEDVEDEPQEAGMTRKQDQMEEEMKDFIVDDEY